MVRAVEVLDSLRVLFAQLFTECVFIFVFEVEGGLRQNWVLFNYFVEDIDV